MAKNVEILVNSTQLLQDIRNMKTLKTNMENFKTNISFEKSKGSSVDEFNNVYSQILSLQQDLVDLYNNTASALKKTRDAFNEKDKELANYFKAEEK